MGLMALSLQPNGDVFTSDLSLRFRVVVEQRYALVVEGHETALVQVAGGTLKHLFAHVERVFYGLGIGLVAEGKGE